MFPILSHKTVLFPDYFLSFQAEHRRSADVSCFLRMLSFFQTIFTHSNNKFLGFSLTDGTSRESLVLRHPAALQGCQLHFSRMLLVPRLGSQAGRDLLSVFQQTFSSICISPILPLLPLWLLLTLWALGLLEIPPAAPQLPLQTLSLTQIYILHPSLFKAKISKMHLQTVGSAELPPLQKLPSKRAALPRQWLDFITGCQRRANPSPLPQKGETLKTLRLSEIQLANRCGQIYENWAHSLKLIWRTHWTHTYWKVCIATKKACPEVSKHPLKVDLSPLFKNVFPSLCIDPSKRKSMAVTSVSWMDGGGLLQGPVAI